MSYSSLEARTAAHHACVSWHASKQTVQSSHFGMAMVEEKAIFFSTVRGLVGRDKNF